MNSDGTDRTSPAIFRQVRSGFNFEVQSGPKIADPNITSYEQKNTLKSSFQPKYPLYEIIFNMLIKGYGIIQDNVLELFFED